MGDHGAHSTGDRIRRAIMNLSGAGGFADRAFNHTAHVVDQIGQAIVAGEYPERTMIPLDPDLEEMFGVSRTVIREAKKTLIAKGMLTSKAKVGTRVQPSSDWNMFDPDLLRWHSMQRAPGKFLEELFEIRLIFEPAAAARLAEIARPEDHAALARQCASLEAARSRAAFAAADLEFHKLMLRLSGNRFLASLGDLVQAALYSLLAAEGSGEARSPEEMREVAQKHRAIVAAVTEGSPERARQAMAAVIADAHHELFRAREKAIRGV
ncbi:FadR/GntR family transcriptional regulator [Neomegalonema sp.]|uniref:FadR/GntR family transcriptional regulator n=1 Tax=Neomegalonema sp. TaxID=2039713 RepID=UPI00260C8C63|nr:FCD domain-containing protein [Neomegalonema sp.]MDD2867412.1 FCD domain-containing protein [Neomegalonema sp.]